MSFNFSITFLIQILTSIDKKFPVFALSFCVVKKDEYIKSVVPALQEFKFKYWGHDSVILHEHEIRKSKGEFAWLQINRIKRNDFYNDLNQIMSDAPITIIASVIKKESLIRKYKNPYNPYELALTFCLERLLEYLRKKKQNGKTTHVIFEKRGSSEDKDLEKHFHQIKEGRNTLHQCNSDFQLMDFQPIFAKKSVNSTGLQLADLTARPIANQTIHPENHDRAYKIILEKLFESRVFP